LPDTLEHHLNPTPAPPLELHENTHETPKVLTND
jgi:hypothetical protein